MKFCSLSISIVKPPDKLYLKNQLRLSPADGVLWERAGPDASSDGRRQSDFRRGDARKVGPATVVMGGSQTITGPRKPACPLCILCNPGFQSLMCNSTITCCALTGFPQEVCVITITSSCLIMHSAYFFLSRTNATQMCVSLQFFWTNAWPMSAILSIFSADGGYPMTVGEPSGLHVTGRETISPCFCSNVPRCSENDLSLHMNNIPMQRSSKEFLQRRRN